MSAARLAAFTADALISSGAGVWILIAARSRSTEAFDADMTLYGAVGGAQAFDAAVVDAIGGGAAAGAGLVGGARCIAAFIGLAGAADAGLSGAAVAAAGAGYAGAVLLVKVGGGAGAIGGGDAFAGAIFGLTGSVGLDAGLTGVTLDIIAAHGGEACFCGGVAEFAFNAVSLAGAAFAGAVGDAFLLPVADLAFRARVGDPALWSINSTAADAAVAGLAVVAVVGDGALRGRAGSFGVRVGLITDLTGGAEFAGGFDAEVSGAADGSHGAIKVS